MRVAIAGSGGVARYLSEEFAAIGLEVILLTRSVKSQFENLSNVTQVVTNFSVSSLARELDGCTALVSAILDYTPAFIDVHLRLIEACKQSTTCKRFIPSEYGGNLEDYPDQPGLDYRTHGPVREALKAQDELEWTLISTGWFADFVVPSRNRHLKDAGAAFPIDFETKKILIPGTGKEPVDFTCARDVAKAVARLLQAPKWEQHTYMSGEKSCWNDLVVLVLEKYPGMPVEYRSLYQLIETIRTSTDEHVRLIAEYQVFSPSHAGSLDPVKVTAHRKLFFEGIKFRTVKDLLEEAGQHPEAIV
ncbi:hypothetical protein AK830_g2411 [Neonectria ditissima]|uniref:NmrA-like domain-containing protein n=1 Tax=Neonectria ditissima TaxID=78410 RepID=A0A0P7BRT8_9HYPO|nr:hypothetical protein AK830_g2411 [Neonectria ditissima]